MCFNHDPYQSVRFFPTIMTGIKNSTVQTVQNWFGQNMVQERKGKLWPVLLLTPGYIAKGTFRGSKN
jgi:hypothetical protein